MTTTSRLALFDVVKGIAIFLVVMGHVLTMCIRQIDSAAAFKILGEVHMPLFFFVSGFFTGRRAPDGTLRLPPYGKRALQLLVPMVVVSTIWIFWFPVSGLESPLNSTFEGLWTDEWKNGYWFTPVLFVIMVLYGAVTPLVGRMQGAAARVAVVVAVSAAVFVGASFVPDFYRGVFSTGLIARFFPVFALGAIAGLHKEGFMDLCRRPWALAVAIVGSGILLSYVCWYWRYPFMPLWVLDPVRGLMHIFLAVAAIGVLAPWCANGGKAVGVWSYIGRKSLPIYLLHYFFLFPLGAVRPALQALDLAFLPLLAVAAFVAVFVVAITLGTTYIINSSRPLAFLLLGEPWAAPKPKAQTA